MKGLAGDSSDNIKGIPGIGQKVAIALLNKYKDLDSIYENIDQIPNLENINLGKYKEKIIQFRQEMFYYKFNLKLPNMNWTGTKGCKKKNLVSVFSMLCGTVQFFFQKMKTR